MGYLTSPGITINEIDSTNVVPALSTSSGGYAGHFNWGPAEQIVSVSSEKELGTIFGAPVSGDTTSVSFLTAASFLKYGNSLSVVRAVDSTDLNATSTGLGFQIKNGETFAALGGISMPFAARYPGLLGNGIQVSLYYGAENANFDYPSGSTIAADQVETNLFDEIHILVTDNLGKLTGRVNTILEKFSGLSLATDARDADGASLYYKDVINQKSAYVYAGSLADFYNNADQTLVYARDNGNFGQFGGGIIDATLSFAGVSTVTSIVNGVTQTPVIQNNIIKFVTNGDIFPGVSYYNGNNVTATFVKAISGVKTCEVTAVDPDNGFINIKYTYSGINAFTAGELQTLLDAALITAGINHLAIRVYVNDINLSIAVPSGQETNYAIASGSVIQFSPVLITGSPVTYHFSGGNNALGQAGFLMSGGTDSIKKSQSVVNALDIIGLSDPNIVDINLLFTENSVESGDWSQSDVDDALFAIVEARRNLVGFISAPLSIASMTSNVDKQAAILAKFQSGNIGVGSSSFTVFDSTPVYVYNKYSDAYSWIAASGHMAGLCANTDLVSEPWYSPAGYTRGQLRGVTKLAYNPNQNDRDSLYKARINPIVSFPGKGILLFGDKTAQAKPGAFDRINVRRLFNTLEKAVANASQYQLFEINDEFTRASFRNTIEPYLRDVKGRRGIIDFKIVCDETNNTSGVIDSNRFVADIFIKPVHSVNFITLNFIATRTGVEFKTLVG